MKFSSLTIEDIAAALHISKSTVSRALANKHDVSQATREKVMAFAREHHYEPNPIAQGLQQRQTFSIGVLVPELKNNFFAQAIEGIDSIAYAKGYQTIIAQSYETVVREVESARHLASRSVDGLIISVSAETHHFQHLEVLHKRGLPIVFFDRVAPKFQTHQVMNDNRKGAFLATELLIKQGHRRIIHITNAPHLSITQERIDGYKLALAKYDLTYDETLLYFCEDGAMNIDEVAANLKQLLARKPSPDAVFSSGDRITTITYQILMEMGYRIPEEIAFVGFSNNTMVNLFHPSISFVRQPAYEMGVRAAELLLQLIESKKPAKKFEKWILEPQIINRFVG